MGRCEKIGVIKGRERERESKMVDYKRIHTKKDTLEMGFNPKTHIGKYCIDWSNTKEIVSVDLEGDKPIFFVQGEEALPFLKIIDRRGPEALLEELDSAGILEYRKG